MDGEDGSDWYDDDESGGFLGGLSDGQRYVLAIVLNLAFLSAVIAGFAYLYASGFGSEGEDDAQVAEISRPSSATIDEDQLVGPRASLASAAGSNPVSPPASPGIAGGNSSEPDDFQFRSRGLSDEEDPPVEDPPGSTSSTFDGAEDLLADGGDEDGANGDGPTTNEPDAAEEENIQLAAVASEGVDGVGGAAPSEITPPDSADAGDAAASLAANVEPRASESAQSAAVNAWERAAQLTMELQESYPCSEFSFRPGGDGSPALEARIAANESTRAIRERIGDDFEGSVEIVNGLGCTQNISAGFVSVADAGGDLLLLSSGQLTDVIRAVLPAGESCDSLGLVIETEPALIRAMQAGDGPAAWVRSGDGFALCSRNAQGDWSANAAGQRRGAALIVEEEVIAASARRAANLAPSANLEAARETLPPVTAEPSPPPVSTPSVAAPSVASNSGSAAGSTPAAGPDGLVEVAPVSGPSPQLPPGVQPNADGYVVTVSFMVDNAGAPSELSIVSAGFADVEVVQAALSNVQQSRFPPATGAPYRAKHVVRFPNATFNNLLDRLSEVSQGGGVEAEPIWDREPSNEDRQRFYPARALQRSISGEATLGCVIDLDGRLECEILEETPSNQGFGRAAMTLSLRYRAAPRMSDGSPSANREIQLPFRFAARR